MSLTNKNLAIEGQLKDNSQRLVDTPKKVTRSQKQLIMETQQQLIEEYDTEKAKSLSASDLLGVVKKLIKQESYNTNHATGYIEVMEQKIFDLENGLIEENKVRYSQKSEQNENKLEKKKLQLQTEIQDMKTREEEFQNRLNDYERRLRRAKTENERLSDELQKLTNDTEQIEVTKGKLYNLKEENAKLQEEVTNLTKTLEKTKGTQLQWEEQQKVQILHQNTISLEELQKIPFPLDVSAKIYYLLGQMRNSQGISKEELRPLEEDLRQSFGHYTQHLNHKIRKAESLYDKIISLEDKLRSEKEKREENLKSKLETTMSSIEGKVRETMTKSLKSQPILEISEKIDSILEKKLNALEINKTESSTTIDPTYQPFTYAEISAFPKLPIDRPKLILATKEEGKNSIGKLKKELSKINMKDLPLVECMHTRTGKILLACNTKSDLNQIKQSLENAENLKNMAVLSEVKPRTRRVIIFGAPEAPRKNPKETNEDLIQKTTGKIDEYESSLQLALDRHLRREGVTMKVIKVLKGRGEVQTSNVVIELLERDALRLCGEKLRIGFYTCIVKKYLTIQRCYRCQMLDHTVATCTRKIACEMCMGTHTVTECRNKEKPKCANCFRAKKDRYYPQPHIDDGHPASSNTCPSYGWALRELINQNNQANQSGSFNKIQSYNSRR